MPRIRLRTAPRPVAGALACLLVLAVAGWLAPAAWAHENRQVGAYQLTVGWQHEPADVGVQNAVQVFVRDAAGKPLDDLGTPPTLTLTISTGAQTSPPLELVPSFDPDTGLGTHGEFDATVIPTAPGTYSFRFGGTVNGQKVDETFTSSDKTFDDVHDPSAVEFPVKAPTAGELGASVDRLGPRVDSALSSARTAKSDAGTAVALAVAALVAGIVLGAAGVGLGMSARRRTR